MPDEIKTIVTKRDDTVPATVIAQTPLSTPVNIQVVAMTAVAQIIVRATRTYLMTLIGLLSAGGIGLDKGALPDTFGALMWTSAGMALAPAVMSVLVNLGELLLKIDQRLPELRA